MRGRQAPACSEPAILICHRTVTTGPTSQGRGRAGPAGLRLLAGLRLPARRSQVCTEGPPSFLAEPSWLSPNSQDAKATGTVLSVGSPPAGEGHGPGAGKCQGQLPGPVVPWGLWGAAQLRDRESSPAGPQGPTLAPGHPVLASSSLRAVCGTCGDREPGAVLFRSRVRWGAAGCTAPRAGSAGTAKTLLLPGKGPSLRPGFCAQPLGVSSVTSDKLWRGQPYQACFPICTPSLWSCWEDDSTWHTPGV